MDGSGYPAQRVFQVKLPMRIQSSKKKKTALNLNIYRNLHFRSLSAQKNNFHKLMKDVLKDIPTLGKIHLHYDVCPRTKGRLDVMNVGSIVDKYFSDSLTELGIIQDDDYTHINFASFGFGGLAEEEHVLVTITEIEPMKGNTMRILLDEDEIQTALETFVETLGLVGVSGVELSTDTNGDVIAEVMIGDIKEATRTTTTRKGRGGRPAGSKNKPKESEDDVAVSTEDSDDSDSSGAAEPGEEEPVPAKSAAKPGKSSKNLFGESQEESSETSEDTASPKTDNLNEEDPVKPAKKSSIFDQ